MPGTSACWLPRDQRARHVGKGCPGTWEISMPRARARNEGAKETKHRWGVEKSERCNKSDEVGEPNLKGPSGAKSSAGSQNRSRERWERHRAHQPSVRNWNG